MHIERLVREPERKQITGVPTSTWYDLIEQGLAPRPVKLSRHAVAWPHTELATLNAARIAGKTDEEIRRLVAKLVGARAQALDGLAA